MRALGRIGTSLGCLVVLGLAGCGAEPTLPVAPRPVRPLPPAAPIGIPPYGQAGPGMPAPGAPAAGQAQALLAEMGRAVGALRSASYQGVMYCRGSVGNKPKGLSALSNGEWEATSTYQVRYQRPEAYRIEVTKCTNQNSVGMKMVVRNDRAQVKLPGILGMLKISLSLGDAQMKNFRGHRLDEGSLTGLARRFSSPPAPDARLVGEMNVSGRMLDLVEIPRAPSFDKTVLKEVIGVDRQTRLPLLHGMFTGERKVYEMKITQIQLNADVSSGFDEL